MKLSNNRTGILFIVCLIGLRLASPDTANLSYFILAVYSLFGRMQAVQAIALSWLFSMLNAGIADQATLVTPLKYSILISAAISVFLRRGISNIWKVYYLTLATMLFGLFVIIHSALFSPVVDISILKVASWILATTTLFSAWLGLSMYQRELLIRQIIGGLIVIMIISMPLIGSPLGYYTNDTGFQGILIHPQVFGPTMALLGCWSAGQMFSNKRASWTMVMLVGLTSLLVVLSESRTAGLAIVLGICVSIVIVPMLSGKPISDVLPGLLNKRILLIGSCALIGIILAWPAIDRLMTNFISKSGRANESALIEAYMQSRGGLMSTMIVNIHESPIHGIGFGVGSDISAMHIQRDPLFGLPMSAPIEKGVLPLALLEEIGIIGLFVFILWLAILLRNSARGGVAGVTIVLTVLFLNLGEYTFFSANGSGLLSLILIGWAISFRELKA